MRELQPTSVFDENGILPNASSPPIPVPPGHVGPLVIPGTGRLVWWTGRVAIGLRHQPQRVAGPMSQSAMWVQEVMLRKPRAAAA